MKTLINLLILCAAFNAVAQEYTVDLKMTSSEEEASFSATIHLAKKPSKLYASFSDESSTEVFIVDSTQKKVLELFDEDDAKEAYLSSSITTPEMEEPEFGLSMLYDMLISEMASRSDYRLLTETKQLFGMTCRKVELLEEGAVVGTGWVLPGVQFGLAKNQGIFMTPDGMLVEMTLSGEGETFKLECLGISKGTVDNGQFSLTIPAGYELIDDSEDYEAPKIIAK